MYKYKMALRNMCLLLFHPAKKLLSFKKTVNTASANVTSLLITLPLSAPDDQAKLSQVLFSCTSQSVYKDQINFLNFSDQNFSLVIVLSLFLVFGQISSWVFL